MTSLCYHHVPHSQPITLLRHFEFIILIIFRVPRSRLRVIYAPINVKPAGGEAGHRAGI